MKAVAEVGGRVATKFAAVGRWQACVQKKVWQIFQKSEIRHPPCGFPVLGGRRLKVVEKIVVSEARGFEGGPQPPG